MNILLLFPEDRYAGDHGLFIIPLADPRAEHMLNILKLSPGDELKAGLVNGPAGTGKIEKISGDGIILTFRCGPAETTGPAGKELPGAESSRLRVELIVGQVRPICAKRILREAAMLGVSSITFIGTDLGEKSYRDAKLWKHGEAERYILDGVVQSGTTRLPLLQFFRSTDHLLEGLGKLEDPLGLEGLRELEGLPELEDLPQSDEPGRGKEKSLRIFLDNVVPGRALSSIVIEHFGRKGWAGVVRIAVGSERGWSDRERSLFLDGQWSPASLGGRILRTETACTAALSLLLL
jgi:16S rRNA (uracil1498-N3)-methyltransferase